jgi:SAM-dependent methyltransferase
MASDDFYDAERFWDAKAAGSGGDCMRAVCSDDPGTNRCIDRIQRSLLAAATAYIGRAGAGRGAALLDYGCGSGRWVDFFERRGYRYRGVDVSKEMLRLARGRWPDASLSALREGRIPHPDRSFDVVCSIAVLHHNPYPEQERMVTELCRVTRDHGFIVLFESVAPLRSPGGIEFPRPLESWCALLSDRGMHLRLHRGARYGILKWAAAKLARKLRAPVGSDGRMWRSGPEKPLWQKLIDRMDAIVDPSLGPILPTRYHRRALMVFSRASPEG